MRATRMYGVVVACVSVACVSGVASAEVLLVPDQFETIQSAIDAAVTGDIVQVQPGVYNENIDFLGKAITVTGESPDNTIIDGTGLSGPVVRFASEENADSRLELVRISRGSGELVSDPVFGDVKCGGGIIVRSATPTVFGCEIEFNTAWGGAGMCNVAGSPRVQQGMGDYYHGLVSRQGYSAEADAIRAAWVDFSASLSTSAFFISNSI